MLQHEYIPDAVAQTVLCNNSDTTARPMLYDAGHPQASAGPVSVTTAGPSCTSHQGRGTALRLIAPQQPSSCPQARLRAAAALAAGSPEGWPCDQLPRQAGGLASWLQQGVEREGPSRTRRWSSQGQAAVSVLRYFCDALGLHDHAEHTEAAHSALHPT